jgi:hypothetical protein
MRLEHFLQRGCRIQQLRKSLGRRRGYLGGFGRFLGGWNVLFFLFCYIIRCLRRDRNLIAGDDLGAVGVGFLPCVCVAKKLLNVVAVGSAVRTARLLGCGCVGGWCATL